MQQTPSSQSDLIAVLEQYQAVCNRYDVAAAVALFAEDGCIEIRGIEYRGWGALHAAHECDRGSQTQVAFSDYVVEGETVRCTFIACDVLDRAVRLDGWHLQAEFTLRNRRIVRFVSLPPDEHERVRHRAAKHAFHAWARAHYPEEVAKGANVDYEAGAALARVVQAWHRRQIKRAGDEERRDESPSNDQA
jgi:hypothetical protein